MSSAIRNVGVDSNVLGREREIRYLRATVVAFLLVIVVFAMTGAQEKKPAILEAQGMVLRDKDGKIKMLLGVSETGEPSLKLFGDRTEPAIEVCVARDEGSIICVNSPVDKSKICIKANVFGSSQIDMIDAEEHARLSMLLSGAPDENAVISLHDVEENERAVLRVDESGDAYLLLMDQLRRSRLEIGLDDMGEAAIKFVDHNEISRLRLNAKIDGNSRIEVRDDKGVSSFLVPPAKQ